VALVVLKGKQPDTSGYRFWETTRYWKC